MRVHALLHQPFEGLGMIKTYLKNGEYTVTETHLWESAARFPDMDKFDLLIVMGGPMNVDEEEIYPWLKSEKAFIKKAIDADKRILGICLGAQLISTALGHRVTKSPFPEIGWFPVEKQFDNHPLFPSLSQTRSFTVMQWHGDMFEIPAGAQPLFSSKGCPNQGYTYNENRVVGLQFHLELNDNHIRLFLDEADEELANEGIYIQNAETLLKKGREYSVFTRKVLYEMLDALTGATD